MRKIINLISAISILSSIAATSTACSNAMPPPFNPWFVNGTVKSSYKFNAPPVKFMNKYILVTIGNGILTSTDGLHWKNSNMIPLSKTGPCSIKPFQINQTFFIAMNNSGLWMSTNTTSWTLNSSFKSSWSGISTEPVKINNTWYIGTQSHGLWKSNDPSKIWTQTGGTGNLPITADITCAPFKIGNKWFVGTKDKGLWASDNSGATWTLVKGNLPNNTGFYAPINKINNQYFIGTLNQGLWTSDDLTTWSQITGPNNFPKQASIASGIQKFNNMYFITTTTDNFGLGDVGTWMSKDALHWIHVTGQKYGLPANIQSLTGIVSLNNTYYLPSRSSGLWTSNDAMAWKKVLTVASNTNFITAPIIIDHYYYLATWGQGLYQKKVITKYF